MPFEMPFEFYAFVKNTIFLIASEFEKSFEKTFEKSMVFEWVDRQIKFIRIIEKTSYIYCNCNCNF